MRKIIQLYFLLFFSFVFSQTELVFVYFKDKPNASAFLANPLSELSQKAIDRRSNLGISITAIEIPEDVLEVFEKNKKAFEMYQKMSYTHRKEYMRWITEAKKPETRENRKVKLIEMILAGKKGI